jgi:hypothetical protein
VLVALSQNSVNTVKDREPESGKSGESGDVWSERCNCVEAVAEAQAS